MDLSLVLADFLAIFRAFFLARAWANILAQFLTVLLQLLGIPLQLPAIVHDLLSIFPDLPTIIPQFSRVSAQLSTWTWPILKVPAKFAPVLPEIPTIPLKLLAFLPDILTVLANILRVLANVSLCGRGRARRGRCLLRLADPASQQGQPQQGRPALCPHLSSHRILLVYLCSHLALICPCHGKKK